MNTAAVSASTTAPLGLAAGVEVECHSDMTASLDEVLVNKYRDGKAVEVREYRTREEALEAVGLSE